MRLDLGNGRYAEYRPGMGSRDPIQITHPNGGHSSMSWGGLVAMSNGEILSQIPQAKTASDDYRLMHTPPDENSGKPLHHYDGGEPEDTVRIYRSAPPHVDYLDHNTWATTDPAYAHTHGYGAGAQGKDWPVISAEVPKSHVFWDENDDKEVGYQGPRLESHQIEHHDEESGQHYPYEHPSEEESAAEERGGDFFHGEHLHLPPVAHAFVHDKSKPIAERAHVVFKHMPEKYRENRGVGWEEDADDAEMEAMPEDQQERDEHGTPRTQVVLHGSQNLEHAHGVSWADASKEPLHYHRDYEHHTFSGDPNRRVASHTADLRQQEEDPRFSDNIFIGFVPPLSTAHKLVQDDGEEVGQLHVTLCFLGEAGQYSPKLVKQLPTLIKQWAMRVEPLKAEIGGAGTFITPKAHVMWAGVNIPGGPQVHTDLVEYLKAHGFKPSQDHGWVPHITLKYDKYHVRFLPKIEPIPWRIDQVWYCHGSEWVSFPLGRG
jgi:2'-5' RNA ligase